MKVEGNIITLTDYEKAVFMQFLINAKEDTLDLGKDYSLILETYLSDEQRKLLRGMLSQMLRNERKRKLLDVITLFGREE